MIPTIGEDELFFTGAPGGAPAGGPPGGGAGRAGGPPGGGAGRGGPGGAAGGRGGMGGIGANAGFDTFLVSELIPYVDGNFRTVADQQHRAMAGLSMGGMETRQHHAGTHGHFCLLRPAERRDVHAGRVGSGQGQGEAGVHELRQLRAAGRREEFRDGIERGGLRAVSFVSDGTRHEFQTWRRSLQVMAPMLFQN